MAKRLNVVGLILGLVMFFGAVVALAQIETFCPSGQAPHFQYGFAFLKQQLGEIMGEPLQCEHYDAKGNAFQQTTTGQAIYQKETNRLTFSGGHHVWTWTPDGLKHDMTTPEPAEVEVTLSPALSSTMRVISYNLLFGAGADPVWARRAAELRPFSYPGNRLPAILNVIKAADPDLLGVQEAAGWASGTPSIAQQVAEELDMNYVIAPVANGLHLGLFTKFEILETENLSEPMGNVGALRAIVSTPAGERIHVFVIHLDPFAATTRANEVAFLVEAMAPYQQAPTILMGDTNVTCLNDPENCREYQLLSEAGWHLALAGDYMIDQIWTSPGLAEPVEKITFPAGLFAISDHYPVGAVIELP